MFSSLVTGLVAGLVTPETAPELTIFNIPAFPYQHS